MLALGGLNADAASALEEAHSERAAVIFYGGSLLVISSLLSALSGSVEGDRHLLRPEVSEKEFKAIAMATRPNMGFYVGVIALAIVAPRVAVFGYLVVAVVAVLRARGDQTRPATQEAVSS